MWWNEGSSVKASQPASSCGGEVVATPLVSDVATPHAEPAAGCESTKLTRSQLECPSPPLAIAPRSTSESDKQKRRSAETADENRNLRNTIERLELLVDQLEETVVDQQHQIAELTQASAQLAVRHEACIVEVRGEHRREVHNAELRHERERSAWDEKAGKLQAENVAQQRKSSSKVRTLRAAQAHELQEKQASYNAFCLQTTRLLHSEEALESAQSLLENNNVEEACFREQLTLLCEELQESRLAHLLEHVNVLEQQELLSEAEKQQQVLISKLIESERHRENICGDLGDLATSYTKLEANYDELEREATELRIQVCTAKQLEESQRQDLLGAEKQNSKETQRAQTLINEAKAEQQRVCNQHRLKVRNLRAAIARLEDERSVSSAYRRALSQEIRSLECELQLASEHSVRFETQRRGQAEQISNLQQAISLWEVRWTQREHAVSHQMSSLTQYYLGEIDELTEVFEERGNRLADRQSILLTQLRHSETNAGKLEKSLAIRDDELAEIEGRLVELGRERDTLKLAVEEARARAELTESESHSKTASLEAKIASLRAQWKQAEKEATTWKQASKTSDAENSASLIEHEDSLNEYKTLLNESKALLTRREVEWQECKRGQEAAAKQLEDELRLAAEKHASELQLANERVSRAEVRMAELERAIDAANRKWQAAEHARKELELECENLRGQVRQLESQILADEQLATKKLSSLEAQVDSLQTHEPELEKTIDQLKQQAEAEKARHGNLVDQLDASEAKLAKVIESCRATKKRLRDDLASQARELQLSQAENDLHLEQLAEMAVSSQASAEVEEFRLEQEEQRQQIARLEFKNEVYRKQLIEQASVRRKLELTLRRAANAGDEPSGQTGIVELDQQKRIERLTGELHATRLSLKRLREKSASKLHRARGKTLSHGEAGKNARRTA